MAKENEKTSSITGVINMDKELNRRDFLKTATAAGISGLILTTTDAIGAGVKESPARERKTLPRDFEPEPATAQMVERARKLGIDLVWDRESHCRFASAGQGGAAGLCCFRCQMGPCTLGDATGSERGACGATRDVLVARGLVRRVAAGAGSWPDSQPNRSWPHWLKSICPTR